MFIASTDVAPRWDRGETCGFAPIYSEWEGYLYQSRWVDAGGFEGGFAGGEFFAGWGYEGYLGGEVGQRLAHDYRTIEIVAHDAKSAFAD